MKQRIAHQDLNGHEINPEPIRWTDRVLIMSSAIQERHGPCQSTRRTISVRLSLPPETNTFTSCMCLV